MSIVFPGRLGLAEARIPHIDRHGLVYLSRGNLFVQDGTLCFKAAGSPELEPGEYAIPYQAVSMILLGPGTSVTHDVPGCAPWDVAGCGGGRRSEYYTTPHGTGRSAEARAHARLWADEKKNEIIRRMWISISDGFPQKLFCVAWKVLG